MFNKKTFTSLIIILAIVVSISRTIIIMKQVQAASLYEFYNSGDNANRNIWEATWRAQTFSVASNHSVTSVNLRLSRSGSPGTVTASIQPAEDDNFPSGIDLTTGTADGSSLVTQAAGAWCTIHFAAPYTLLGGAKYAIVIRALSGDSSNFVRWRVNTGGGYDGGTMLQSADGGSSWTKGAADCMFEVWGEFATATIAEAWVDDDWAGSSPGDNVGGHIFGYDAFATVQDGINAIIGSTVHVAAGVYQPLTKIRINKNNLLLLGPQAAVDPRPSAGSPRTAGSAAEAIIDGSVGNLGTILEIDADNATINGFEVKSGTSDLVHQGNSHSGTTVKYCIVHDGNGDDGIQLKQSTDGILENNYVYDMKYLGDALSIAENSMNGKIRYNEARNIATANAAIYVYDSDNMEIVENLVDSISQSNSKGGNGIRIGNKNGLDINRSGGLIKHNIIRNVANCGIEILTSNLTIENNDISSCSSEDGALFINYAVSGITVRENSIHDNTLSTSTRPDAAGIFIENGVDVDNVSIRYNNIYHNEPFGLTNESAALLDAVNNWWGANNGPNASPGSGDSISGNVEYDPWLIIRISACPPDILVGGASSIITADMTHNSNGDNTLSGGHIPDGTEIIFTTDKGSIGSLQVTRFTLDGQAIATLTSSNHLETATISAKAPGHETQSIVYTTVNFYAEPGPAVGGEIEKINKLATLAPWLFSFFILILGGTVLLRQQKNN